MPDTAMDLVFLDTETLGLHPDAPIWEFAALRRFANGGEDTTEFRIRHDPAHWVADMMDDRHGEQFVADYVRRYNHDDAIAESDAAIMMHLLTRDALVIACNPIFDLPRIEKLIVKHGMTPSWHYHPFDISSVLFGALNARTMVLHDGTVHNLVPEGPPWKSDALAAAVGVRSEDYARHTSMGDVLWTAAQFDAVTGRA